MGHERLLSFPISMINSDEMMKIKRNVINDTFASRKNKLTVFLEFLKI